MVSKNQTNILNMVLHVSMCFMISLMVSWTDAYTESCDASLLTMKNVTECPTDKESYEKAADMKNCSSISDSCKKRVQYHCVLNSELNGLVEVCATSIYIFDKVCAKFDENLKGIIRVDGLECQNFSSPCPISYNSTETYKYPGCFDVRSTTVSTLTTTSMENLGSTKKSVIPARNDRQKVVPIVFGVLSALALLTVILISFVFLRRRKLLCFKIGENTDRMAEEKKQLVQLPRYQENRKKAKVKAEVSMEVQDKRKLLETAVNFLIESLKKPNEGWTKESITEQVDNTINKIQEVGDRVLLKTFITKLAEDPDIQKRLIPCGAEMYQLLLSVQDKYDATKSILEKGCISLVLYFDDDNSLKRFVNDFKTRDVDFIKCISKLLLNKNFLSIFQIHPEIVTWKTSTVKVFQGSELMEELNLERPIVGTYKDFTEDIIEVHMQAQVSKEVTPIYPSLPAAAEAEAHKGMNTAGKLQEEQILDGFDSTPNAYPAYKHVQTREKSFEECKVGSIKDRAWDFARDGFYYEGYDLETTCFHCGTQKGDWKKGADIHAEHMSLNQTCEFVKYVQLHILKTK
ncbi:uncharacterized protein LOC133186268 [Saccostrea echinata]|uniref:uncharacterized protein LOC133186268 n=1 Tax=Saccostrea echinata TaxID=191078 RepID=UPI002A83DBE5|nr:uncharacterized protein LOC133186268 [Saccostrea echinata]